MTPGLASASSSGGPGGVQSLLVSGERAGAVPGGARPQREEGGSGFTLRRESEGDSVGVTVQWVSVIGATVPLSRERPSPSNRAELQGHAARRHQRFPWNRGACMGAHSGDLGATAWHHSPVQENQSWMVAQALRSVLLELWQQREGTGSGTRLTSECSADGGRVSPRSRAGVGGWKMLQEARFRGDLGPSLYQLGGILAERRPG